MTTAAHHPEGLPVVVIDGGLLLLADIEQIAHRRAVPQLADGVLDRVARSAAYADDVALTRPVYGRSTGVGANRSVRVTDPDAQALRLLRSHASTAGPLREAPRVRAMLTIRLNQLAADGNGIAPSIVDALAGMLAADALPPVREWSGIGTGDLGALGTTGLALLGEVACARPVPSTIDFGAGDSLTFMSSNAAALGDAALAIAGIRRLAHASLVTAALSWSAVRGSPEAFASAVESVTPFHGVSTVCRALRWLTASPDPVAPGRIQDPFGLRTLPQVAGAWMDAVDRAESVVLAMAGAASENPTLSPVLGVAHHGGFHAAYLGQALDALGSATAQGAQLVLSRTTMLADPAMTGGEPFLADGTAGASGTMALEFPAAAALAQLVAGAAPAGLQAISISRGLEDGASFASLAATQALAALEPLRVMVAVELLTAARALGSDGAVPHALGAVLAAVTAAAPSIDDRSDRDLTADLAALTLIVDQLPELAGLAGQIASSSGRSSSA